jgi:hypothetical protein
VTQRTADGQEPDLPLEIEPPPGQTLFDRLRAPFQHTYTDVRGGVELTYVTGAQVIARLNLCCGGPLGWSFTVVDKSIDAGADEVVVHGRLGLRDPEAGEWVYHDQFGSQKIKRSREARTPLDIGFDYMGATTAALKKCASLAGVGLYLMAKPVPPKARAARPARAPASADDDLHTFGPKTTDAPPPIKCQGCGAELVEHDGKPPYEQANASLKEFRRVYCAACAARARSGRAVATGTP